MSEKIYALLFRLFPSRFRAAWQEDALDLFRQRARDERGFVSRVRLWCNLAADLAASVPRVWLREEPALVPAADVSHDAVPSFTSLDEKPIRSSAYFYGTVLTLSLLFGVSILAKHAGHFPMLHASNAAEASGVTVDPWATGAGSGGDSGDTAVIGNGAGSAQAAKPTSGKPVSRIIGADQATHLVFFDGQERRRVIDGILANLKQHYANPALGNQIGHALQVHERSGDYDSIDDPRAFAAMLTQQLRSAAHDTHFEVIYSQAPMRGFAGPSEQESAAYAAVMRQANCTFEDVRMLPHGVGYLKLDTFPDPEVCGDAAIAAMKTLSRSDALIIDLRENSGGSPAMVMFLAGWLFDRPAFFWNPRENNAAKMWTRSPMAGSRLADKPVFVLTSRQTYSAAEHFSYNLKMLHRATLVGETTAGATDVGAFHRIDEHFGIALRESKVPNPYPVPDWAVNGVSPDVQVPAAQAFDKAETLAMQELARR